MFKGKTINGQHWKVCHHKPEWSLKNGNQIALIPQHKKPSVASKSFKKRSPNLDSKALHDFVPVSIFRIISSRPYPSPTRAPPPSVGPNNCQFAPTLRPCIAFPRPGMLSQTILPWGAAFVIRVSVIFIICLALNTAKQSPICWSLSISVCLYVSSTNLPRLPALNWSYAQSKNRKQSSRNTCPFLRLWMSLGV